MKNISYWTDELLNKMRFTGDEAADFAVNAIFENANHADIYRTLGTLARNDQKEYGNLDPKLVEYLDKTEEIPCTAEELKMLDKAGDFFNQHGFRIVSLLFFKSLPTGYMCTYPAHVLHRTKLLENQAGRRVFETAQFIFDVCKAGWYKPEGTGIRSIQKVRLMHAGMRHMISKDTKQPWDINFGQGDLKQGVPINQEDLLLTCQLFSIAILRGLELMGVRISEEEKQAYFFNWRVVGLMLGIKPEIMPEDLHTAWLVQEKIYSRLMIPGNDYGHHLTDSLIEIISNHSHGILTDGELEEVVAYFAENPKVYSCLKIKRPSYMLKKAEFLLIKLFKVRDTELGSYTVNQKKSILGKIWMFITFILHKIFGIFGILVAKLKMEAFEYMCKKILAGMTIDAINNNKTALKGDAACIEIWQLGSFSMANSDQMKAKGDVNIK